MGKKIKSKKARVTTYLGVAAACVGILFFLLRGPYLSNSIKRILIPVLENATGERVLMDKAVINLFPFYLQAKSLKVFDRDGNRLLWVTKARAYIDLLGLLSNEIRIRNLTIQEPDLTADEEDVKRIVDTTKKSVSTAGDKSFRVSVKNIKLVDGKIKLLDAEGAAGIFSKELFFDMKSRRAVTARLLLRDALIRFPNQSEIQGTFKCEMVKENDRLEIKEIDLRSSGSFLEASGEMLMSPEGKIEKGTLNVETKIVMAAVNRIFSLKTDREGELNITGLIDLAASDDALWPAASFHLETDSQLYLESLMEILDVKDTITGNLSVKGKIEGTYPKLYAKGTSELREAVFDTLSVDDITGEIKYKENTFSLNNFTAHTYGGELKGDAFVKIPHGDYSVTAAVAKMDSPDFFTFIKWDAPFPKGKINGKFTLNKLHDRDIEVAADIGYKNTSITEGDVLGRVQTIETGLELRNDVVTLKNSVISTASSDLYLNGDIDLYADTLLLDVELQTGDTKDITAPHYTGLIAPARFEGKVSGLLDDPFISGNLRLYPGSVHGIPFTSASSDLKYHMTSLKVEGLRVNQEEGVINASGEIEFKKAKKLFSFVDPYYRARLSADGIGIKSFVTASYKDIPVSGLVNGMFTFEGEAKDFKGKMDVLVRDSEWYGQHVDSVQASASVLPGSIDFHSLSARRGDSAINAEGTFFFNKQFKVSASSEGINIRDIHVLKDSPVEAVIGMNIEGAGSFDAPDIGFSADIRESSFRGVSTGSGEIKGRLAGRELKASGKLVDGMISAGAKADFTGIPEWEINANLGSGKYDFLLSGYLDTVPEDLSVFLEGDIHMKSADNHFSVHSLLNYASIDMFGYDLKNEGDIDLVIHDGLFTIKNLTLSGRKADLSVTGQLKIGEEYNITLTGSTDIAPFKEFSEKITSLKGMSDFRIVILGQWEDPELTGEIHLAEAAMAVEGLTQRIGPLNGSFSLNQDRITFESVETDFAGGRITASGAGYLDKLATLRRLLLSLKISGVTIRPEEQVSATFDGGLFYEFSGEGSSITGNIDVGKARYSKKIQIDSLILGLKEAESAEYPAFLKDTLLNIRVKGIDNIRIDNNIAKTDVGVVINILGTVKQPGLIGRIEADEGTMFFRSNEFTILQGSSVEFIESGKIIPIYHIIAESYISDYYVKLILDGSMDEFTLNLFSDPPLSEADILALLTIGQAGREARGFESGLAAGEAATILTGGIMEEVENITGFDRFQIEPHTTTSGALSPKLTIGRRLLEDRLLVIYSTAIGTTEESVISLKYRLSKKISILGSRNEIGSAGVDLKYKFEFK